jgi:methionine biosynthesis protein MetW
VLDLGCGEGELLEWLAQTKGVDARGVEISSAKVQRAIARGVSVFQSDIDAGLADYPDQAFDYVILSQTLQEMRHPLQVLREMLRVGRRGIVAFPNFGHWRVRFSMLTSGGAPRTPLFPHEWYDSPNIHFLTVWDFETLAAKEGIRVERRYFLAGNQEGADAAEFDGGSRGVFGVAGVECKSGDRTRVDRRPDLSQTDYDFRRSGSLIGAGRKKKASTKIFVAYYEGMRTALGFRAHSGWAALVAVAGTIDAVQVLDRRRIIIADPEMPGSKQPYHAAAELAFPEAEALVRRAIESSRALAVEVMSAAVKALRSRGHEVVGCGVLLGSGKALPGLEKILRSHASIHTAEGAMFRDV